MLNQTLRVKGTQMLPNDPAATSYATVYGLNKPPPAGHAFLQTQEAERMIEQMEQDEDVLIERLKKVQDEQRKAYELLQESLES